MYRQRKELPYSRYWFDIKGLKEYLSENPNNQDVKDRIEYLNQYNKTRPNRDAYSYKYPGCYEMGKHR